MSTQIWAVYRLIIYCMHDCLSYVMTPFPILKQRMNIVATMKKKELFCQKSKL